MLDFHEKYHPITSRPFLSGELYTEYQPCGLLRPYLCCYWSADRCTGRGANREVLVIPDTCMDIIIYINHTKQTISGNLSSIQNEPFISVSREAADRVSVFAVRFYFWAAHLFLNLDFKDIRNQSLELTNLGSEWNGLFKPFFYFRSMEEKINWVERFLLKKLEDVNQNSNLFLSFQQIVSGNGGRTVRDICECSTISQRQMERQFLQTVGLPMKRIANLVRYQNVWKDMVMSKQFDIQDAVYRYGYTDQSHLLKEFKRFHGITPEEAKRIAYENR